MASSKVPITFIYQKPGTNPPVYVAGTFSDPAWQPQEMDVSVDQHGHAVFTKEIEVDDASEIQYKFRIGSGDWWTLDEDTDKVTDDKGNQNNILRVSIRKHSTDEPAKAPNPRIDILKESGPRSGTQTPEYATTASEVADSAKLLDPETPEPEVTIEDAGKAGLRRLSNTPIGDVARTAAEVADAAAKIGDDDLELGDDDGGDCPMFPHECFRPADTHESRPASNDSGHHQLGHPSGAKSNDHLNESYLDYDDPSLEQFPSDNRDSIMAAMRRLSTSIEPDHTIVDVAPLSPVISNKNRHQNMVESPEDITMPPSGDQHAQAEEPHEPHETNDSTHADALTTSMVSLQSIAEDDEVTNEEPTVQGEVASSTVQHPGPAQVSSIDFDSPASDEDEGIAMNNSSKKWLTKEGQGGAGLMPPERTKSPICGTSEHGEQAPDKASPVPEERVVAMVEPTSSATVATDRPSIIVHAATSGDEGKLHDPGSIRKDEATSTAVDASRLTHLHSRATDSRPTTSSSTHSLGDVSKDNNWLQAFFRTVFVDWIGGFVVWLCGRNRNRA